MEFADGASRHALRCSCCAVYGLSAVGAVCVPLQNAAAVGLCQQRGAESHRLRVPFWGATAAQLTLIASSSRLGLLEPLRALCRALQDILTVCPAAVELRLHDCRHDATQAALEWLAADPFWSCASLRFVISADLFPEYPLSCRIDAACSRPLKARLVWCDTIIVVSEAANSADTGPFVVLRNMLLSERADCVAYHCGAARLFPAVRHVFACVNGAAAVQEAAARCLVPLADRISALSWTSSAFLEPP